ncbi:hypothetical protein [Ralstonia phage phiRSL1]|uniref:Uncharacterized protein n=1 Tax=Ralstonia phage phiRSL1 TaxID=1980924 RepID=B2ZYE3_9CAUD|nr:hypothetical protein RSL1_ORF240 [Ralstonia phage phiRSL1]BAG41689.1 hypothetical protein [Ralstonia phage phiRSL1]
MLEQVIPNAFVLTNKRSPRTDLLPGLVYYFNSEEVPFHSEWYSALHNIMSGNRVAGMKFPQFMSQLKWRPAESESVRDQLFQDGYNYVGMLAGIGVVIFDDQVTLYNGQSVRLIDAVTLMLMLKILDQIAEQVSQTVKPERQSDAVAAHFSAALYTMVNERLLWIPRSKPLKHEGETVPYGHQFEITAPTYAAPVTLTFDRPVRGRLGVQLEGGVAAHALNIQRLLYLPDTLTFDHLEIQIKS